MSTDTADVTTVAHEAHDDGHAHPTDKLFVKTAVILTIITAVEVAWSYLPIWDDAEGLKSVAEVGGLLIMMAIKFVIIAGTFMHLKFDNKVLTRVFYTGLLLAFFVYIAALTTFRIWGS